jgi:hypothetical protein
VSTTLESPRATAETDGHGVFEKRGIFKRRSATHDVSRAVPWLKPLVITHISFDEA